jgi:hypothetical protein
MNGAMQLGSARRQLKAPNPKLQIPKGRLSINCGVEAAVGSDVNGGLPNDPFPLTPALSLGEREARGSTRFKVPMHARSEMRLSNNRRTNMPLLRSLLQDQGTLATIDVALLRSFSMRSVVPVPQILIGYEC